MTLYIGLMSGTSMDGIDAALVDVETNRFIAGLTRPYSETAKQWLEDVLYEKTPLHLGTLSQLNTVLGREFAAAVLALLEQAQCSPKDVRAIGSHGQTICHDVTAEIPYTVQLACPHTIADITGIPVVADFRTRDVVVGGKGAPFAPLYHHVLFTHQKLPLAVVNIGGIANVTFLEENQPPRGYDTGPGNCLMDIWACEYLNKPYDANGAFARSGKVIEPLLQRLLSDPFFQLPAPKSIGKEYFSRPWLNSMLPVAYAPQDVQATLLALTATSISHAIITMQSKPLKVVLCGGGVYNAMLHQSLQRLLNGIPVCSSAAYDINPEFIEAMMFAWLADKTVNNISMDLTALTGAKKSVILGAIYGATGL